MSEMSLPLLLLLVTVALGGGATPPPMIALPLYQGYYVSVQLSNDGGSKLLRIRFDEDKIALYGSPSGGTYDAMDGSERIMMGPGVVLQIPVHYTYQGDPR